MQRTRHIISQSSMKAVTALILAWTAASPLMASSVYQNSFDNPGSLDDFTIYGEEFVSYTPPALHAVSIDDGQLRIDTDYLRPNGPTAYPVLLGMAQLSVNTSTTFGSGYNAILSQNNGLVSWSFNLSNQDGTYNNSFSCILASTKANSYSSEGGFAQGYALNGGGMVGNRLALRRFDYGMGGGGEMLIDITEGLGPLPDKGSFRITFDPSTSEWSLYGETGPHYTDPTQVDSLLGSAVDNTYTHTETGYFGLVGRTTGTNYFDNVSVDVVPEPASILIITATCTGAVFIRRRFMA